MRTCLSPEVLAELHTEAQSKGGRFVNPHTIARCQVLLRDRGEEWAASVLLRRLDRRSRLHPNLPWLHANEEEILVLADEAEWSVFYQGFRSP